MFKQFFPDHYLKSIFEIQIQDLKEQGIKGIIFDIDNTLVPYDEAEPHDKIITLFEEIRQAGIKITLVSNNNQDRVVKFNEKLKVFAIHKSQKPLTKSFKKALRLMACEKEEAVIVGDQIFTDIYGGNRAGLQTILVVPVSDKDEWMTKVKRGIEKRVIARYEKGRKSNNW